MCQGGISFRRRDDEAEVAMMSTTKSSGDRSCIGFELDEEILQGIIRRESSSATCAGSKCH